MRKFNPAMAVALLVVAAGCGPKIEGPDTTAPVITFAQEGGKPFYSNSSAVRASNTSCPGGLSPAYSSFAPDANFIHVRGGGTTAKLTVTFADPSGIKRAYLQIPDGTLRSPRVNKTIQIPTASGDLSKAFEFNFIGAPESPQTTYTVSIDMTHRDSNRIFNVFAVDFKDNTSSTASVLVGEQSNLCR